MDDQVVLKVQEKSINGLINNVDINKSSYGNVIQQKFLISYIILHPSKPLYLPSSVFPLQLLLIEYNQRNVFLGFSPWFVSNIIFHSKLKFLIHYISLVRNGQLCACYIHSMLGNGSMASYALVTYILCQEMGTSVIGWLPCQNVHHILSDSPYNTI